MIFRKLFAILSVVSLIFVPIELKSQEHNLKPGFSRTEYIEMLKIAVCVADTPWVHTKMIPENFRLAYRSPVTGLDNRWDLWTSSNNIAVFSFRGTTPVMESWLENFYAAMVPATGSMKLSDNDTFEYKLSENPRSAVHAGWLMATGYMAKGVLEKLDSCYRKGYRDMMITGHSQGGGISFLVTAWLHYLQKSGSIPADVRFKTYCSAAPKPGNLYFAYDYETFTSGGWAYNVVNTADWVPETPLSVQTIHDFNIVNPFVNAKKTIRQQTLPTRLAMNYAFRRLDRPAKRAVKNHRKYLGKAAGKFVGNYLPGYQSPEYLFENNYVRTGSTIVLYADEEYYKRYADDQEKIFMHHMAGPYLYLIRRLKD